MTPSHPRLALLLLLLPLIGCPIQYPPPAGPTEIRVVTYNTHYFGKHDAAYPDGADMAALKADVTPMNVGLGADLWLCQEVYRSLSPNPNPYSTDHVARLEEAFPGFEGIFAQYTVGEGKFAKGTAILWNTAKFEPVGAPISFLFQATGSDSTKGGCAQILSRLSDSKKFLVACVHLAASVFGGTRTKQAKEAVQILNQVAPQLPWILGGDLNTVWRTAEGAYRYLVNDVGMVPSTGATVATHKSGLHLDWVMARGMGVIGGEVRNEATHSDHYPVFARFDYP